MSAAVLVAGITTLAVGAAKLNKKPDVQETVTVSFKPYGNGTLSGNQTLVLTKGTKWSDINPPIPEASDYLTYFSGWYWKENEQYVEIKPENMITENCEIYARFQSEQSSVSVLYYDKGQFGEIKSGNEYSLALNDVSTFGELNKPVIEPNAGYYFAGWYLDPNFETLIKDSDVIKQSATVYAKCEQYGELKLSNIKFEATDATEKSGNFEVTVLSDETKFGDINKPYVYKEGNIFEGWVNKKTGAIVSDDEMFSDPEVNLVAKFSNVNVTKIKISSTDPSIEYIPEKTEITVMSDIYKFEDLKLPVAYKDGFYHSDWTNDAGDPIDPKTPITGEIFNIHPKMEPINYYTITFEANGGTLIGEQTQIIAKNQIFGSINPSTVKPSSDDLMFNGWYYDKNCTKPVPPTATFDNNTSVYAGFATKKYNVKIKSTKCKCTVDPSTTILPHTSFQAKWTYDSTSLSNGGGQLPIDIIVKSIYINGIDYTKSSDITKRQVSGIFGQIEIIIPDKLVTGDIYIVVDMTVLQPK